MENGTKLVYVREDAGLVTDTHIYLTPGIENAVEVGKHLSAEQAESFVLRGWLEVYTPLTAKEVYAPPTVKEAYIPLTAKVATVSD